MSEKADRISKTQRDRYERQYKEAVRLRSELHCFALWISPIWDDENEDDVASAERAVDAFLAGEEGPNGSVRLTAPGSEVSP